MSSDTNIRRYPRLVAYLPTQCSPVSHERPRTTAITGKTNSISSGGLGLLLPESIPLRTPVMVQVCLEEPLSGLVIWHDSPMLTDLGTRIPHGVAFDHLIDSDLILQWLRNAKRQAYRRVPVQFDVKFTQAGKAEHGTCLNLSSDGMFIGINHPPLPGTEILLRFNLHGPSHTFSIPAQVVWMRGEELSPSATTGMGVKFLEVNSSLEAALIDAVIDRLRAEASPSPDSSQSE